MRLDNVLQHHLQDVSSSVSSGGPTVLLLLWSLSAWYLLCFLLIQVSLSRCIHIVVLV